jgi:hypothetical protein
VINIIAKIIESRKCIDDDTMRDYFKNTASQKQRDYIMSHLGYCEKCQERFHSTNFGNKVEDHLQDDDAIGLGN